jgi:transcriptional regulator with XRE-family HTH domain
MSQQELAARAGLRREKLNRIESRDQNIGLDELCRLLDALGLELYVRERRGSPLERDGYRSADSARKLVPQEFHKASFIDGSKAKILSWGKVPR